jgi:hypothetical protein
MKTGNDELTTRYVAAHAEALAMLDHIRQTVEDYPAPDTDRVTWGHVGELEWIIGRIKEIAAFYEE